MNQEQSKLKILNSSEEDNFFFHACMLLVVFMLLLILLVKYKESVIESIEKKYKNEVTNLKMYQESHARYQKKKYRELQDEIIKRGYANLVIDRETREVEFVWVSDEEERKDDGR